MLRVRAGSLWIDILAWGAAVTLSPNAIHPYEWPRLGPYNQTFWSFLSIEERREA